MCLVIDKSKHPRLKPKIAWKRIPVYKLLYEFDGNEYLTIIQHSKVFFSKKGICKQKAKPSKLFVRCAIAHQYIEEGIHSYFKFDKAIMARGWTFPGHETPSIFAAYIPFGSRYYIGVNGDMVSTKLIINKNKRWM